ncbi:MAG TPA: hypothetical protein VGN57_02095 [Pirellulaceae bacterium]|jgi:hypothetical protein|nr:hypothetical protein [Pirellulaceae bacterium]
MRIFIVLHHEIMGTPEDCRADEMVFFTCTSFERALELIRSSRVDRWSWWEIQTQELDSADWPEHVGYYGLRGGKLSKPSYEKCVELFRKERRTKAGS